MKEMKDYVTLTLSASDIAMRNVLAFQKLTRFLKNGHFGEVRASCSALWKVIASLDSKTY